MHKGKLTNVNPPRITTEPLFRLQKKVDKSCFHALHVLNPFVYQCFGVKGDR
jgi:hypothetical protein